MLLIIGKESQRIFGPLQYISVPWSSIVQLLFADRIDL